MSEEEMGWGRRGREEDSIWHYRIIHILHTHNTYYIHTTLIYTQSPQRHSA
jgi:hypothetical protein